MAIDSKKPIDMRVRVPNDGGPLHSLLVAIPDSIARNDRLRQLAYLGLMVERNSFFVAPANDPIDPIKTRKVKK